MLHLRRVLMLLLVVLTTLVRMTPGQKVDKDGLPDDKYNLEDNLEGDAKPDQGFAMDDPGDASADRSGAKRDDKVKRGSIEP